MNAPIIPPPKRLELDEVFKNPGALKRVALDARGRRMLHQLLDVADLSLDVLEHNQEVTRQMRRAIVEALGEVAV